MMWYTEIKRWSLKINFQTIEFCDFAIFDCDFASQNRRKTSTRKGNFAIAKSRSYL